MITLDLAAQTLSDGTRTLRMTATHCRIIQRLSWFPGCASHDVLCQAVGGEVGDPRKNLMVHICTASKRLAANGWPPLIRSVWGTGYSLAEPVRMCNQILPAMIPGEKVAALRKLLWSHHDQAAAEPFLCLVGV